MEKNISVSEDMLLDFYLDAISIKNAIDGLVSLFELNEDRSGEVHMQDLTVLKDVTKAISSLVSNHTEVLGKASGYR